MDLVCLSLKILKPKTNLKKSGKTKLIASSLSDTSGTSEFQTPEIDKDEIETNEKIGSGCFGNVYKVLNFSEN